MLRLCLYDIHDTLELLDKIIDTVNKLSDFIF